MPQMSPLWWSPLFMIFSILFIILISLLFTSFQTSMSKKSTTNPYKLKICWKW